jgi:hypothetical protein
MITLQKEKKGVGKLVGKDHVNELVRNYKTQRWAQNTERIGKPDSLSAWYSLENLQEFLDLARENNADGIKLCFGVYPEGFEPNPTYSGRQTVVMIATREKETGPGISINKEIYFQKDGKVEILAFNFSSICPPSCGDSGDTINPWNNDLDTIGITIFTNKYGMSVI